MRDGERITSYLLSPISKIVEAEPMKPAKAVQDGRGSLVR